MRTEPTDWVENTKTVCRWAGKNAPFVLIENTDLLFQRKVRNFAAKTEK